MRRKKRTRLQKTIGSFKQWLLHIKQKDLVWLVVLFFAIFAIIHSTWIARCLRGADWSLVKDYLAILITWPVVVLVLGLIFIFRFSDSIKIFLEKLDHLKAPGVELSQQQAPVPPSADEQEEQKAVEDLESKADDGSVTLTKEQVDQFINIFETMDFKYLNLHLVQNTKNALRMIAQIEVRKDAFLQVYQVPAHITDQLVERQAILNSLFDAGLIIEDNNILKITDKGMRFLNFIGLKV